MIDVNGPQAQYDAEERCLKIARTAAKYEYTKNVIQEIIGDIKNWYISAVASRYKMFYNCPCGDIFASAA